VVSGYKSATDFESEGEGAVSDAGGVHLFPEYVGRNDPVELSAKHAEATAAATDAIRALLGIGALGNSIQAPSVPPPPPISTKSQEDTIKELIGIGGGADKPSAGSQQSSLEFQQEAIKALIGVGSGHTVPESTMPPQPQFTQHIPPTTQMQPPYQPAHTPNPPPAVHYPVQLALPMGIPGQIPIPFTLQLPGQPGYLGNTPQGMNSPAVIQILNPMPIQMQPMGFNPMAPQYQFAPQVVPIPVQMQPSPQIPSSVMSNAVSQFSQPYQPRTLPVPLGPSMSSTNLPPSSNPTEAHKASLLDILTKGSSLALPPTLPPPSGVVRQSMESLPMPPTQYRSQSPKVKQSLASLPPPPPPPSVETTHNKSSLEVSIPSPSHERSLVSPSSVTSNRSSSAKRPSKPLPQTPNVPSVPSLQQSSKTNRMPPTSSKSPESVVPAVSSALPNVSEVEPLKKKKNGEVKTLDGEAKKRKVSVDDTSVPPSVVQQVIDTKKEVAPSSTKDGVKKQQTLLDILKGVSDPSTPPPQLPPISPLKTTPSNVSISTESLAVLVDGKGAAVSPIDKSQMLLDILKKGWSSGDVTLPVSKFPPKSPTAESSLPQKKEPVPKPSFVDPAIISTATAKPSNFTALNEAQVNSPPESDAVNVDVNKTNLLLDMLKIGDAGGAKVETKPAGLSSTDAADQGRMLLGLLQGSGSDGRKAEEVVEVKKSPIQAGLKGGSIETGNSNGQEQSSQQTHDHPNQSFAPSVMDFFTKSLSAPPPQQPQPPQQQQQPQFFHNLPSSFSTPQQGTVVDNPQHTSHSNADLTSGLKAALNIFPNPYMSNQEQQQQQQQQQEQLPQQLYNPSLLPHQIPNMNTMMGDGFGFSSQFTMGHPPPPHHNMGTFFQQQQQHQQQFPAPRGNDTTNEEQKKKMFLDILMGVGGSPGKK
jgi:hypothetical protein